ncbi:hypothetical protein M011DRAFT_273191 [Sporormia fimetaria CBS 119925]|uniref:Rhodopsin domain-containing protein n=1 Tax=Sporormia fimetaria CBS 119925 TaxID=1340428 RepID=A0A6A6VIN4_9PLEO|nr:hypothetical protein M011DRAFT_273191 [Sporormia fimetaria CBS 119925]
MILPRDLYNESPPERRSRISNNPTLLYSWWCTIFSLAIIASRVCGRYVRNERLFTEDKVMAWSIIPLLIRMGLVHVVLRYGTNNVDIEGLVNPVHIHNREVGSKVVLAARIFYALYIWMAKFTISEFLKRMTERFWKKGYENCLRAIRAFLVASYFAVVISTLAECQPFDHYWQVVPDPGPKCRQGYAHLLTMGVTDIFTDVLLVVFPIPIILVSAMPARRKLSLVALFSLSVGLVAIASARIPLVIDRRGLQQFRTVLASSEILAATVVSNAIVLGSFLRDRGVKKPRYKGGSTADSADRRSSTRRPTLQNCGSDEHLARSLGYRTNPELADPKAGVARPAPVADLSILDGPAQAPPFAESNWQFPGSHSDTRKESAEWELSTMSMADPQPSPRGGRRVSFFDAGGLLEEGSSPTTPTESVATYDFAFPSSKPGRKTSHSLANAKPLQPAIRRGSRLSQQSAEYDTSSRRSQQLHDLRTLLAEGPPGPVTESSMMLNSDVDVKVSSPETSAEPGSARSPYGSVPSLQDPGGLLTLSSSSPSHPSQ